MQRSRLKKMVRALSQMKTITVEDEKIKEIDAKVNEAVWTYKV
jgi:hypothetical protein